MTVQLTRRDLLKRASGLLAVAAVGGLTSIETDAAEVHQERDRVLVRNPAFATIDLSLRQAVDNLILSWRARQPGIAFAASFPQEEIAQPLDEVAYRVIQESLSNAIRHGRPRHVEVAVRRDGGDVLVRVADDGLGFEPIRHRPGHGLNGMEERIRALGGRLALEARPGGGVVVSARLPANWEAAPPEPETPAMALPA